MNHSPTDTEQLTRLENRRLHVFTWRTTQAMRKRLAALPRDRGSVNQIITKAVEEYLKQFEAWGDK